MGLLTRTPTATVTLPDGSTARCYDRHAPTWAVVGRGEDGWQVAEWLLDSDDRAAKLRWWIEHSHLDWLRVSRRNER